MNTLRKNHRENSFLGKLLSSLLPLQMLLLVSSTSVHAINVPSCCDKNNFDAQLGISPVKNFYHEGDVVTFDPVTFDNAGALTVNHRSCNVSNINVDLIKPNLAHLPLLRTPDFMLGS